MYSPRSTPRSREAGNAPSEKRIPARRVDAGQLHRPPGVPQALLHAVASLPACELETPPDKPADELSTAYSVYFRTRFL